MQFSLEAVRARHGDCLILHHGTAAEPRWILIDGGPRPVYGDALKPRLEELRAEATRLGADEEGALVLDAVIVSHIDDDHIGGLLGLTDDLISRDERGDSPRFRALTLWHNAFDDVVDDTSAEATVATVASVDGIARLTDDPAIPEAVRSSAAVVASVAQGNRLRREAHTLGWPLNKPIDGLVRAPDRGGRQVTIGETSILVIAPLEQQIEDLRERWAEDVAKLRARGADEATVAAYVDESVFNLSSIVCIVEKGGKRMLLTGDARGDHILQGLGAASQLQNGKAHFDLLKLPHHGSDHNVATDFFARVTADHYLASGDGRHGNPESATFEMLCAARPAPDDGFQVHLTYRTGHEGLGPKIDQFFRRQRDAGRTFGVSFRPDDRLSLVVDLLDPLG
jgi:Metallo-beta-lactamase superfamily